MKVHIEIRPGEGGEDARLLVGEQAKIYGRYAERNGIAIEVASENKPQAGWTALVLTAQGPDEKVAPLLLESGGHRWQRCPPSEHRGRIHTSTVTVAVMEAVAPGRFEVSESDIETRTSKGSGPGGQHRNTTCSLVTMKHLPTGITVRIDGRDQHRNRAVAREILEARVAQRKRFLAAEAENERRKALVGSGERGDKIRTYREVDDRVTDHRTGKKASLRKVRAGEIALLT